MIELTWKDCEKRAEIVALKIKNSLTSKGSPLNVFGVPRGGTFAALLVCKYFPYCNMVSTVENCDFIVDDLVDSGTTKQRFSKFGVPFFELFNKSEFAEWVKFPWENSNQDETVEDNIVRIMQYIGEDVNREGLIETPKRVVRSYEKLFGGYKQNPEDFMKVFEDGACKDMVLLKNIEFYSTCEHHMLPFYGKCHIAYIPNGKVIGVSKLARLMEIYARRMQIQERIGQQVTQALEKYLNPLGAACIIEAQHFCMTSRGVEKQNAKMVTSSLTGNFLKPEARQELMMLIKD